MTSTPRPSALSCMLNAGVLVSTSLGAFGPLFGSDYVYNATALDAALTALGVSFPNDQLARGQHHVTHRQAALPIFDSRST